MKISLLKSTFVIAFVFTLTAAIDTPIISTVDCLLPEINLIEPSTFEIVTWELEVSEFKATLEGFLERGILAKHAYTERRALVHDALECLIIERLLWEFPSAIGQMKADYDINLCCEKLFTLETMFIAGTEVGSVMVDPPRLTEAQNQHLFDLEGGLQTVRLYVLTIFYSPEMQHMYSTEVTESLNTILLLRAHLCRLNFPITPETMKFNALLRVVEISANWYLEKPMKSPADDRFQLALLHSMRLSTRKVLFIIRTKIDEVTNETLKNTTVIAKQAEFLAKKCFFFYFLSGPFDSGPQNRFHLFNIQSNPIMKWIFRGVFSDLYKITQLLRIKKYYLPNSPPSSTSSTAQNTELISTQVRMGILIQFLLESMTLSLGIHFETGPSFYRKNKLEVMKKDAEKLLNEFEAWHLEQALFPRMMDIYNDIQEKEIKR